MGSYTMTISNDLGVGSIDFESDAVEENNAVRMDYGLGAKYFLNVKYCTTWRCFSFFIFG
jgi:hypothetical protein